MSRPEPSPRPLEEVRSPAEPPDNDGAGELARTMEEIRRASEGLHALVASLVDADLYAPGWDTLRGQLERRDELLRTLGRLVMRASAIGKAPTAGPPIAPEPLPGPPVSERPAVQAGGALSIRPPTVPPSEPPTRPTGILASAAGPRTSLALTPSTAPIRTREIGPRDLPTTNRTPDSATPRRTGSPSPAEARAPQPRLDLTDVLKAIGRPVQVVDEATAKATVTRLLGATRDLDRWLGFSTNVQRSLVGLASSIARHLQDEAEDQLDADAARELRAWFPSMSHWSKLYRPGFVPGLSRRFGPERDSWLEDAEQWWLALSAAESRARTPGDPSDLFQRSIRTATPYSWMSRVEGGVTPTEALNAVERALSTPDADLVRPLEQLLEVGVSHSDPRLLRIVLPHAERVQALPGLKTLKAAIRDANSPDDGLDDENEEARPIQVADDWPHFGSTEGKSAVMIGGDPRTDAVDRIRSAFRFTDLQWEESDPRRVDALVNRIRGGTVDLVILLRGYLAHRNSEILVSTCKELGVPYVLVDTGYGVAQVKRAIERYLGQRTVGTA